jgi:excisionase family DNA binding protein
LIRKYSSNFVFQRSHTVVPATPIVLISSNLMSNPFEAIEVRLTFIEKQLLNISESVIKLVPNDEDTDLIGIKEVAKMLNLAVPTIYTKTHNRTIPFFKKGKKLQFSRKRIQAYLAEGEVKTVIQEFKATEMLIASKINNRLRA